MCEFDLPSRNAAALNFVSWSAMCETDHLSRFMIFKPTRILNAHMPCEALIQNLVGFLAKRWHVSHYS